MTGPIETLRGEHIVIERALDLLERHAPAWRAEDATGAALARWCVKFLQCFADACHHAKEETALFPLLEARGLPRAGGPLGVMLREHELARALVGRMAQALGGADAAEFASSASEYAALLRQHIAKENDVLFLLAKTRISEEDAVELEAAFERIEQEKGGDELHHRFHRELADWERKVREPRGM